METAHPAVAPLTTPLRLVDAASGRVLPCVALGEVEAACPSFVDPATDRMMPRVALKEVSEWEACAPQILVSSSLPLYVQVSLLAGSLKEKFWIVKRWCARGRPPSRGRRPVHSWATASSSRRSTSCAPSSAASTLVLTHELNNFHVAELIDWMCALCNLDPAPAMNDSDLGASFDYWKDDALDRRWYPKI